MTGCVHKVKWSVKRPEDCRFRLSVSHYKDRIVAPDEYTGATEVTPSDQTQVLATKDKLVREDITVEGITGTRVITENGTYDVVGDKSVTVDVPQKITYDEIASGTKPSGDITLTVEEVVAEAFRTCPNITGIYAPNCKYVRNQGFMGCSGLTSLYMPNVEVIGATGFSNSKLQTLVLPSIKELGNDTFAWSPTLKSVILGKNLERVGDSLLRNTSSGWVCKFLGTPKSIGTRMFYNVSGGDIYVPWSEGEVSGAPWGATGATIHYNTIYDDDWNVISST